MIAVSVEKPNALTVVERDSVVPEHGEVLVRVRRAGICGSDVHILHGSNPFARYPRIIGHEFAGEVEEVGPDVSDLAPGDRTPLARGRRGPLRPAAAMGPLRCSALDIIRSSGAEPTSSNQKRNSSTRSNASRY